MGLPQDRWDAILEDPAGTLWVRSAKNLYMRIRGADRFQRESGVGAIGGASPVLGLDSFGRLLVSTDDGLARRAVRGWETVALDDGMGSSDISSLFRDREGNVWLGLMGSGLARWLGYNEWQSWSDREGLSRSSIWSLAKDAHGTLWAGTQSGLDYAQVENGGLAWKHQPIGGMETIRSVISTVDDALWIAGNKTVRLDIRTHRAQQFGVAEGLPSSAQYLMADHQGRVWASTRQGLYRSSQSSRASTRFEQIVPTGSTLPERFAMTAEDRNGVIWAAGDLGLARIDGSQWTRFTSADGLKSNTIAQVAVDTDGSVWIGYRDTFGITHLSFADGRTRVEHFTTSNGLQSDKSIFLGFDHRGWLWVGTDHGVDVFDRKGWRHLGRADGLIWDDCNANAFLATADGAVWLGTSRGLSRFEPQPVAPPTLPPQVVFTSVLLGGIPFDPRGEEEIPWNRRPLQIRFSALTYANESSGSVPLPARRGGLARKPRSAETPSFPRSHRMSSRSR